MNEITLNPGRFDPYKNYKFRVKWDGQYIPGITRVSSLSRTTDVVQVQEGVNPDTSRKTTGMTRFGIITLERALTGDLAFEKWADLVWKLGAGLGAGITRMEFRKDVVIELYNETGHLVRAYKAYRCWPSHYQALSGLDAGNNALLVERLELECEGWQRDLSVTEIA
jgi:phage tail-like protein